MQKSRFLLVALMIAVCLGAIPAQAQRSTSPADVRDAVNGFESTVPHRFQGVPTDWADRSLVFSEPAPRSRAAEQVQANPRHWLSKLRRSAQANVPRAGLDNRSVVRLKNKRGKKSSLTGDWTMSLGTGGTVGKGMYPAKYSFNVTTASCPNDFVVFNTSLLGSSSQASIIAFTTQSVV